MKKTVRNIKKDFYHEEKFYFDLVTILEPGDWDYKEGEDNEIIHERMTNNEGEGLFEADNFYKQYIGTCEFSLHGKSIEAARSYIKRHLCKNE